MTNYIAKWLEGGQWKYKTFKRKDEAIKFVKSKSRPFGFGEGKVYKNTFNNVVYGRKEKKL